MYLCHWQYVHIVSHNRCLVRVSSTSRMCSQNNSYCTRKCSPLNGRLRPPKKNCHVDISNWHISFTVNIIGWSCKDARLHATFARYKRHVTCIYMRHVIYKYVSSHINESRHMYMRLLRGTFVTSHMSGPCHIRTSHVTRWWDTYKTHIAMQNYTAVNANPFWLRNMYLIHVACTGDTIVGSKNALGNMHIPKPKPVKLV